MNLLSPLESLLDQAGGDDLPLPPEPAALYGPLRFPLRKGRPYVIGNFVTTMDGVASLRDFGQYCAMIHVCAHNLPRGSRG